MFIGIQYLSVVIKYPRRILKLFQHRTLCLKDGHEGFTVKQIYRIPVVRRVHIKDQ